MRTLLALVLVALAAPAFAQPTPVPNTVGSEEPFRFTESLPIKATFSLSGWLDHQVEARLEVNQRAGHCLPDGDHVLVCALRNAWGQVSMADGPVASDGMVSLVRTLWNNPQPYVITAYNGEPLFTVSERVGHMVVWISSRCQRTETGATCDRRSR